MYNPKEELTRQIMTGTIEYIREGYFRFLDSERGSHNLAADFKNFMVYEIEQSLTNV